MISGVLTLVYGPSAWHCDTSYSLPDQTRCSLSSEVDKLIPACSREIVSARQAESYPEKAWHLLRWMQPTDWRMYLLP